MRSVRACSNTCSRYGVVVARGPYPCSPLSPNCNCQSSLGWNKTGSGARSLSGGGGGGVGEWGGGGGLGVSLVVRLVPDSIYAAASGLHVHNRYFLSHTRLGTRQSLSRFSL